MKCKMDFITNSSSTCFVLQYNISLKEKPFKCDIKEIEKKLKEISEKYNVAEKEKPDLHCYSSSCYLNDLKFLKDEESGYIEDDDLARIYITIEKGGLYNESSDDVEDSLLMDIDSKSGTLCNDPEDLYTDRLIEIISDCLKDVPGDLELFFSQIPRDIGGDGWNTGDPMGQYSTIYELFTNQTKIGQLVRKDNIWQLILNKVGG